MPAPQGHEIQPASPKAHRSRLRQWSRTAWAMALIFGSLPLASRLFLGVWGFDGAAEIACLLLMAAAYLHLAGRRKAPAMPDPAAMLDQAGQLASTGRSDRAIAVLTKAIRQSPQFWQAFQYRGELYLQQGDALPRALDDFSTAIKLAPEEPHLYVLRGHAYRLLGDEASAQRDFVQASLLASPHPTG
jgi:Flp pilus assembly protein TadD